MRQTYTFISLGFTSLALVLAGCAVDERDIASGTYAAIAEGSPEAAAVLALVNDPNVDQPLLDDDVGLDRRAATNIIDRRDGPDAQAGTGDDDLFASIAELDGVAYVGQAALEDLLAYAQAHGYGPSPDPGGDDPTEAQLDAGVLALVNDPGVDQPVLDEDVGLDRRAATNIIDHRDGADAVVGTADDDPFDSIAELDDVAFVGPSALQRLRDYALANGYVETSPAPVSGRPDLGTPVQYENPWCTYADSPPYVASVNWSHPDVQAAMSALTPGFRSTFSYTEWRVAYGLESDNSADTDAEAMAKARNFMRVLCGEHRDYPDMIGDKLAVIGQHTHAAGPGEMAPVTDPDRLFDHLTYPAYVKLVNVMRAMHTHRSQSGAFDGYHYGFQAYGHGSRRVDHAVAPMTHCEMRFVFDQYLVAGAPSVVPSQYEADYAAFAAAQCDADDFAWMYNFRGHVNFQPLWLESNGFIFNSRRARGAQISTGANDSYLRPFATRHHAAKQLLASYLFHADADHPAMIQASEAGGGPILYITDRDQDGDGLSDYRLFNQLGCGDQGVGLSVPSQNCNMVGWTTAWNTADTTGHSASWNPLWWDRPDMGFMSAFTTFQQRMSRFNQALDRHTNWGPTGYYMLEASSPGDTSPRFFGAYSPIVAASYDVSASDFFVRRNYPSTDSFEQGQAKWLFVMRFPAQNYYDAANLAAGDPIDFDTQYFNETALSNDYYDERALDHFGYVEGAEMHAQIYLTYGDRGQTPPAPLSVPAP
ncbi:MAG: hypothetical protein AAF715_21525 [Myxococcota bacterium]